MILKGANLGNWLLLEFWMMGQSTEEVDDQCTLEEIFVDRFGESAPAGELFEHFGFSTDNVVKIAKELL